MVKEMARETNSYGNEGKREVTRIFEMLNFENKWIPIGFNHLRPGYTIRIVEMCQGEISYFNFNGVNEFRVSEMPNGSMITLMASVPKYFKVDNDHMVVSGFRY